MVGPEAMPSRHNETTWTRRDFVARASAVAVGLAATGSPPPSSPDRLENATGRPPASAHVTAGAG